MSFIGPVDEADLAEAARQTPIWGSSIRWDLSEGATPGIPIINIGPWGRDYHHWLERVHAPYAFEVLPVLLQTVTRHVLDPGRHAPQDFGSAPSDAEPPHFEPSDSESDDRRM
jgi:arginine utilization protein RocB